MSDVAIRVDGIGKKYHIGGPSKIYDRLGDQVVHAVIAPFQRAKDIVLGRASSASNLQETFWALKDVSFEVNHGEVIGVIGRNGAGKSTLLKILSRITEPTVGSADLFGRVGSLLEVGTGFHPELTGRENIYLNGAILGMNKQEIDRKMSDIVDFAEIGQFLDTPVKHYSSGMYVRLAFSISAHLDPEILIVDEVLAVGDIEFQRKCLGKMDDASKEGRTVLFVSHNMGLIQTLCTRGILLHHGRIVVDRPITEAVAAYLRTLEKVESINLQERTDRKGQGSARLTGIDITGENQESSTILRTGDQARFVFHVSNHLPGISVEFSFYSQEGQPVANFKSKVRGPEDVINPNHHNTFICDFDQLLLLPGRYRVDVGVFGDDRLQDYIVAAKFFDVVEGIVNGRLERHKRRFNVCMPHHWILPGKN